MKILEEKLSQKFNDTFSTKKITVLHECDSDIDHFEPYKSTYLALYKNDKLIGFITDVSRYSIIVPKLFKVNLLDKKAKFGVFNVNEVKMIYKGNFEPHLNENGFEATKIVKVTSQFNFKGSLEYSQISQSKKKIFNDIF